MMRRLILETQSTGLRRWRMTTPREGLMLQWEVAKKCVVFLCNPLTKRPCGTAFLYTCEATETEAHVVYLVTANHVLKKLETKGASSVVVRGNPRSGPYVEVPVSLFAWTSHEDQTVDLAAIEWNEHLDAEIHAETLGGGDWLADKQRIENDGIGAGDTVFIGGLFSKHWGNERNQAIVRTGTLAMLADEPVPTKLGKSIVHLIEARSTGGLSGSPVFVHMGGMRQSKDGTIHTGMDWIFLLGVIYGHWDVKSSAIEMADSEDETEQINMGIALVTPADFLRELLNQECFVKDRKEKKRQQTKASLPTMDSADESLKPAEAHPKSEDPNEAAKSMIDEIAQRTEKHREH